MSNYNEKFRNFLNESAPDKDEVQKMISDTSDEHRGNYSDGYHSFNELYEFRKIYNAVLFNEWAKQNKYKVVKSKKHADGELCFGGGRFVVVAELPKGQISNHYKMPDWNLFKCKEVDMAPEWDGHMPADVLERLKDLI